MTTAAVPPSTLGISRAAGAAGPTVAAPRDGLRTGVTVVVPTFREVDNLPKLIDRIDAVRRQCGSDFDLLIMDDDSNDGTVELIRRLNLDWVELVVRTRNRGLSPAVLEGVRRADRDFVVVMDADLSHPPEAIPQMLETLRNGADFVIGSRYAEGGTTDAEWGAFRWLNSKVATWLARALTTARDPMSGFLAFRRGLLDHADPLNPVGYKIGLELLVKCRCRNVREVPIHFADRQHGESKLSVKEQLKYIQHLRRLYIYRYPTRACMLQFAAVGAAGTVVNLFMLTMLLAALVPFSIATIVAIAVSMSANFWMNRRFTFSYALRGSLPLQYLGYVAACSMGALVNYWVTVDVYDRIALVPFAPQVAAVVGVLAGMGVNFFFNRYFVFRRPAV